MSIPQERMSTPGYKPTSGEKYLNKEKPDSRDAEKERDVIETQVDSG